MLHADMDQGQKALGYAPRVISKKVLEALTRCRKSI